MSATPTRLRRRVTLVLAVAPMLLLAACSNFRDASSWTDPKAKVHFMEACQGDTRVGGGSTTVVELASKDFCGCVFDDLKSVHTWDWDKMVEWEKTLEGVDANDPPETPVQVKKAIEACAREGTAGPAAPGTSTTTTTSG